IRGNPVSIEVCSVNGAALIEDSGRPGRTSSGLSASGAFDRGALRQANVLVGNRPGAAAIEALTSNFELRVHAPALIAIAGASGPVGVDSKPSVCGRGLYLPAGARLRLGAPAAGVRY